MWPVQQDMSHRGYQEVRRMNRDVLICGVGGQGTVLASRIIASAAMEEGSKVHSAETIGMAQRGGSVTSHVRIGDEAYSPLVPYGSADLLLAFEPGEAVRNLCYLKEGGIAIVNKVHTQPVTAALNGDVYDGNAMCSYLSGKCTCIFVDSDEVSERFGSSRYFNIYLLGVACGSGRLDIGPETMTGQIRKRVKAAYVDINIEVFNEGFKRGRV